MNNEQMEILLAAGINVTDTLERFGNQEMIYKKFLNIFLEDKNYEQLIEACLNLNYEAVFKTAHTIKGMSANLGIDSIYQITSKMVELYRQNEFDESVALLPSLQEAYKRVTTAIQTYLNA